MVEHRQPVCKLAFERMSAVPEVLYGEQAGSSYQGQQTMLSKHFAEHAAAA
jgi:dCTP deaminase